MLQKCSTLKTSKLQFTVSVAYLVQTAARKPSQHWYSNL